MTELAFWSALGILSGACGFGFVYLLGRTNKNCDTINNHITNFKIALDTKPSKDYVYEHFYDKSIVDLHIRNIERSLADMSDNYKSMSVTLNTLLTTVIKNNLEEKNHG